MSKRAVSPRWEVYQESKVQEDGTRFWRWRAVRGGRKTSSGESYTRKRDAIRAVRQEIEAGAKAAVDPLAHIVVLDL